MAAGIFLTDFGFADKGLEITLSCLATVEIAFHHFWGLNLNLKEESVIKLCFCLHTKIPAACPFDFTAV